MQPPGAFDASVLPPLREVIAAHGLAARKGLGQHFLLDRNVTDRIARLCGDLAGVAVLEVGPGPGGLTRSLLAAGAREVLAVELDPRAEAALAALAAAAGGRLRVMLADARAVDAAALLPAPRMVCANLPYNVGTVLLVAWLRQAPVFTRLVLMFQQEVAERIVAPPATPAYGRLSVLAQATCDVALRMRLPAEAFVPPPAVNSAVVVFTPRDALPPGRLDALERITAAAFGQRRKMLRSALKPVQGAALLARAGIDPARRAETLTVAEFLGLADIMAGDVAAAGMA